MPVNNTSVQVALKHIYFLFPILFKINIIFLKTFYFSKLFKRALHRSKKSIDLAFLFRPSPYKSVIIESPYILFFILLITTVTKQTILLSIKYIQCLSPVSFDIKMLVSFFVFWLSSMSFTLIPRFIGFGLFFLGRVAGLSIPILGDQRDFFLEPKHLSFRSMETRPYQVNSSPKFDDSADISLAEFSLINYPLEIPPRKFFFKVFFRLDSRFSYSSQVGCLSELRRFPFHCIVPLPSDHWMLMYGLCVLCLLLTIFHLRQVVIQARLTDALQECYSSTASFIISWLMRSQSFVRNPFNVMIKNYQWGENPVFDKNN